MTQCQRCGKDMRKCMCHADFNLEDLLEQFKQEKKAGKVNKGVTEEQIRQKAKEKKPQTKSDLIAFFDFIGFDQNARERTMRKVGKSARKAGRGFLHDLVDDLLPEEKDVVIEAEYTIECPVCGKQVKDLENHECKRKK